MQLKLACHRAVPDAPHPMKARRPTPGLVCVHETLSPDPIPTQNHCVSKRVLDMDSYICA